MGKLFSIEKFEPAEKSSEQIIELIEYLKEYIEINKEKIKNFFDEINTTSSINNYKAIIQNSQMEITRQKHQPRDYSIKMIFDDDEELPLNLELYNIGGLLSKNGILYQIIMFYSYCCSINLGEESDDNAKIIRINQCLKAIDNDNIKFLSAVSDLKMNKTLLNIIKNGYNLMKSWFKGASEPIAETIFGHVQNFLIKAVSTYLLSQITLVSRLVLTVLGIIMFIPNAIYGNSAQKEINEYIKKKNRINLDIILEIIRTIFMDEEEKVVLDFFRNNNIYAVAYDSNKNYHKNEGAAFFGYNIEGMGKKARQLKKDSKTGFDPENIDENQIYDCYEKNIIQIMKFFKDTKDNFKRILILPKNEDLTENKDFILIKERIIDLNKNSIKDNDILTTTNSNDSSMTEPLLKESIKEDKLNDVPKPLEDENKNEEIEDLNNIINELNEIIEQQKNKINNLTAHQTSNDNKINSLQTANANLQNSLNSGYIQYENKNKEIENLRSKVYELNDVVCRQKNEINKLLNLQKNSNIQINLLQEENVDLYVKCKNYEEKYNDIKQKNENNKKKESNV